MWTSMGVVRVFEIFQSRALPVLSNPVLTWSFSRLFFAIVKGVSVTAITFFIIYFSLLTVLINPA